MKKLTIFAAILLACAVSSLAQSQSSGEFNIKKVEISYPSSPDIAGQSDIRWTPQKWARIDVTFDAVPEMTDELVFNYYILVEDRNDRANPYRLLVGRVNHINIAKGMGLHSSMYISPKAIQKLTQKKAVNFTQLPITQISVTISKPGVAAPLAFNSLKPAAGDWWSKMKQEEGFLINKTETPWAALYWDYYESIRPSSSSRY